jgi:hypothetical protein
LKKIEGSSLPDEELYVGESKERYRSEIRHAFRFITQHYLAEAVNDPLILG